MPAVSKMKTILKHFHPLPMAAVSRGENHVHSEQERIRGHGGRGVYVV